MKSSYYFETTIKDVVEAIAKDNGLNMGKYNFFGSPMPTKEGDEIHTACAIGNAAVSLGCDPDSLYDALNFIEQYETEDRIDYIPPLGDIIAEDNDAVKFDNLSWDDLSRVIEAGIKSYLDQKITVKRAIYEKEEDHYIFHNYLG